jgi:chromosomal replication initiator protein
MYGQLELAIDPPCSAAALWERVLPLLEARLGREAVRTWLRGCRPVSYQGCGFRLGTGSATGRDWIEKKYASVLAEALQEAAGHGVTVEVVVEPQEADSDLRAPVATPPRAAARAAAPVSSPRFVLTSLNDKYTFENFVVGVSNRFAHAAAASVSARPGRAYNPLFLYGETGLGKTHLLQAIGHELRRRNPAARVAYASGETFTSHFVTSLRESREEEFKSAYRSADVWLVDDIQFVADKNSTREEFFHTFNDLYLTNRQIVLAADRPPQHLRLMEDRLRSRLGAGLMAEIAAPELETRMAIVERRALAEEAHLPADVVLAIASSVDSNIRALEAALIRVLAQASLSGAPLTAEMAIDAVEALACDALRCGDGVQAIQRAVCKQFGVDSQRLARARDQRSARARRVAMFLLRDLGGYSLAQIGDLFGGKTHSTVVYGCQKLEQEMKQDRELASTVRSLAARLRGKPSK